MRRLLRASVVGAVALVASLGASAAADTTPMTRTNVKSAGVSLAYPRAWTVVPVTKKGLESMRKAEAKKNPKVAEQLANMDPSAFKFLSVDPTRAGPPFTNVTVEVSGVLPGGTTAADLRDEYASALKPGGDTLRDVKAVKVDNKTAFRLDPTAPHKNSDGTVTTNAVGQMLIPGALSTTVVTVNSTDDATGGAQINSILASVRRI